MEQKNYKQLTTLKKILSEISYIPDEEIEISSNIFDDLDIDSLGLLELFVQIEKSFGQKLDPAHISREEFQTPERILGILNNSIE